VIAVVDGNSYVITGGDEGLIKVWKFDAAGKKFDLMSTLEGHTRGVTCLYLHGNLFLLYCIVLCRIVSYIYDAGALFIVLCLIISFIAAHCLLLDACRSLLVVFSPHLLQSPECCGLARVIGIFVSGSSALALVSPH
jgi:WD40 repeat protein